MHQSLQKLAYATKAYLDASLRKCRTCRSCGAPVSLLASACNQCGDGRPVVIPPIQCACLTAVVVELLMLLTWVA